MMQRIEITVPETWQKLTGDQLEYVSKLLLQGVSETELLTRCFLRFAGMKLLKKDPVNEGENLSYLFQKKGYKRFWLDVERFGIGTERMKFLAGEPSLFRLPVLMKKYRPVDWRLYSVSLEEYLLIDRYYKEYINTRNMVHLDTVLAIIYRLPGEKWDSGKLERWKRRFRRMPAHKKHIAYMWFTGLKVWFINKYWYAYNSSSGGYENTPADEEVLSLVSALNDGNVTLNKQILETGVHEVLYEINQKIERASNHV